MNGVAADNPDFLIDLGDTVAMDNGSSSVAIGDTAASEQKYKDTLPYFNIASGFAALSSTPRQPRAAGSLAPDRQQRQRQPGEQPAGDGQERREEILPEPGARTPSTPATPAPTPTSRGDQLKQDYYSWTWGDALFVVISPFWTTTTKPYTTSTGGGEGDTTGSGNRWDWTLGLTQFNWLQSILAGSSAKYKFVFSHQIVGGNSASSMVDYGHGGVDSATLVEWGGNDVGGSPYTWSTNRSGWGSQPIRQMMEANDVTAFFHGHDHQIRL